MAKKKIKNFNRPAGNFSARQTDGFNRRRGENNYLSFKAVYENKRKSKTKFKTGKSGKS